MRRRFLVLGLLSLLGLVGVFGAVAGSSAAPPPTAVWSNAIEVPGSATLNSGAAAQVNSVSCPTAGNCAAGGYYEDGSSNQQAFVVGEKNGSWGNAVEVPGTAVLNGGGNATVNSVSCVAPGA